MAQGFYYTEIRIESNSDAVAQSVARSIVGKTFTKYLILDDGPYAERESEGVMGVRYCGYARIHDYEIDRLKSLSRPAFDDKCRILVFESTTSDWIETFFHEFKDGKHEVLLHDGLAFDGIDEALLVVKARAGNSKAAGHLAGVLDSCGSHVFDSYDECACFFGKVEVLKEIGYKPPKSRIKAWEKTIENLRQPRDGRESWEEEVVEMIAWMEKQMLLAKSGMTQVAIDLLPDFAALVAEPPGKIIADPAKAWIEASFTGNTDLMREVLSMGFDPDTKNSEFGLTALHHVASAIWIEEGRAREVIHFLLDSGADASTLSSDGDSPAEYAQQVGRHELAELLMSRMKGRESHEYTVVCPNCGHRIGH